MTYRGYTIRRYFHSPAYPHGYAITAPDGTVRRFARRDGAFGWLRATV